MSDTCILTEAKKLVLGDRRQSYGHPAKNLARTAKLWSVVLGVEVSPQQVALCMLQLKIAREIHAPKRDNRVDLAGYAAVLDLCYDTISKHQPNCHCEECRDRRKAPPARESVVAILHGASGTRETVVVPHATIDKVREAIEAASETRFVIPTPPKPDC